MNKGGRNNGIYAAENILKQRTKDGKVWYLMKWKGYSPRFNTWEPEENVLDDRLLKAYRKRVSESKGKIRKKRTKQTEGDGNPTDDKSGETEVDIEGVDSSNEVEQESRDNSPSTSAEQPVDESPRKWRKRRKTNNPDTPLASTENNKENTEVLGGEVEQTASPLDVSMETLQEEESSEVNIPITESEMKELSVQIPDEEQLVTKCSTSPAVQAATPNNSPPLLMKTLDTPACSSAAPSPSDSGGPVSGLNTVMEKESPTPTVHVSPTIATDLKSVCVHEDHKPELQQDKKSILSKSSNFDFLANSIIITDVTTERGTVTVKECSAYGDFFGPEVQTSH